MFEGRKNPSHKGVAMSLFVDILLIIFANLFGAVINYFARTSGVIEKDKMESGYFILGDLETRGHIKDLEPNESEWRNDYDGEW